MKLLTSVNIIDISSLVVLLLLGTGSWETLTSLEVLSTWETLTLLSIDLLSNRIVDGLELLSLLLILILGSILIGVQPLVQFLALGIDLLTLDLGDFVLDLIVLDHRLNLIDVLLEVILGLNLSLSLLVSLFVLFSLLDESVDLILGESSLLVGDGDIGGLSGSLVLSSDSKNTIGVEIEGDFDLRNSSGSRGDSVKIELAQKMIVRSHWSLSLEDLNLDSWLVVSVGGEDLGLLNWDGCVSLDELGHDSSGSLDSQRQRGDVQQQKLVEDLSLVLVENGGLNGGSIGNGLIRIDGLVEGSSVEELREELLNLGDSRGASDQDDILDLILGDFGVAENLLDWLDGVSEVVGAEVLELGSGDVQREVLSVLEGVNVDLSGVDSGEHSLGSLALGPESSEGLLVLSDVGSGGLLEMGDAVVDQSVVEVLSSEMGVSGSGLDLEETVLDGQEGDVEGTTSQVEDEHESLIGDILVESVGDGGGGGLVDDSHDVESGDGSGVLGGLSLRVVEIGRDCHDGVLDLLSEVVLGDLLHLGEDHRGDLLWVESLGLSFELDLDHWLVVGSADDLEWPVTHVLLDDVIVELSSDESLGIKDGVVWVLDDLVLSGVADKSLSFSEGNVRRGGSVALVVGDDLDLVIKVDSNARIGSSQINSDSFRLRHNKINRRFLFIERFLLEYSEVINLINFDFIGFIMRNLLV